MHWYYVTPGQEKLAIEEQELAGLAQSGVLRPQTLLWHDGLEAWQPAGALKPELFSGSTLGRQPSFLGPDATVARGALAPLVAVRGWLYVVAAGFSAGVINRLIAAFANWRAWGPLASVGSLIAALICGLCAAFAIGWALRLGRAAKGSFDDARSAMSMGRSFVIALGLAAVGVVLATTFALITWGLRTFVGQ